VPHIFDPRGGEVVGELDWARRIVSFSEAFPHLKAFTIAHEIGHHQLHRGPVSYRDLPGYVLGPQPGRPEERDANRFATALLMPPESVRNEYFESFDASLSLRALTQEQVYRLRAGHDLSITREQIEAGGVRRLALLAASCSLEREPLYRAFAVSKEAMAIRLEQLGLVAAGRSAGLDMSPAPQHGLVAVIAEPRKETQPEQSSATPSATKTVVLVGDPWEHAQNRILLKRHGWTAVDDDSPDALGKLRNDPPCGVVVHSSFWKHLSSERREGAFKTLIELSSCILVRVDLCSASELVATAVAKLPSALLDQRPVGAFRQTSDCCLDDADLSALERVFDLRQKAAHISVRADTPGDTSLLKLIAAEHLVATSSQQDVIVTAERLARGNSGARAYVLSTNEGSHPVFVKVDEVRPLAAEVERARQFQRRMPDIVVPELRFHGLVGALTQPFISAEGTSTRPAPSLESFLERLSLARARRFLESILPTMLKVFMDLATQRTSEKGRHLEATFRAYRCCAADGLKWMQAPMAIQCIDDLGARALRMLTDYDPVAFVHGDAHLRNILLRNSTGPVLVDFAHAGPGHPLLDFVRLEMGIWTVLLRQAERDLAEKLVQELLAHETISSELTVAFQGRGQAIDVALQSSAMIRESCRAVTRGDASWFEQYRSMHALLALLALRRPEDQFLSFAVFSVVQPAPTGVAA
jgi:Zn-dependent peptidase ImmA (M78 family)